MIAKHSLSVSISIGVLVLLVACRPAGEGTRPVALLGGGSGQVPSARFSSALEEDTPDEETSTPETPEDSAQTAARGEETSEPVVKKDESQGAKPEAAPSGASQDAEVPETSPGEVSQAEAETTEVEVSAGVDEKPVSSPSDVSPQIISFTASTEEADPGDTITLSWKAVGRYAKITQHYESSTSQNVPLEGTLNVAIEERMRTRIGFTLEAGVGQNAIEKTVFVSIRCPDAWFFEGGPDGCPSTAVASRAAAQYFEHGFMIWVESHEYFPEGAIHFFVDHSVAGTGGYHGEVADDWKSSMPESDPGLVPPSGLYQPIRGFGLLWREGAESFSNHDPIRDVLGWALAPEYAFDTIYQCEPCTLVDRYNSCFLRGPDGKIIEYAWFKGWSVYE